MADQDLVIQTNRLHLLTVLPTEYEVLAKDQADPNLYLDRGFCDPNKHFKVILIQLNIDYKGLEKTQSTQSTYLELQLENLAHCESR